MTLGKLFPLLLILLFSSLKAHAKLECEVLKIRYEKSQHGSGSATGFVIELKGSKYIVTTEHSIIAGALKLTSWDGSESIDLRYHAKSWTRDIALLTPTREEIQKADKWKPCQFTQQRKFSEAYPVFIKTFNPGIELPIEPFPVEGILLNPYDNRLNRVAFENGLGLKLDTVKGMSGSPVIDANGFVLGMHVRSLPNLTGEAAAISADDIVQTVRKLARYEDLDNPLYLNRVDESIDVYGLKVYAYGGDLANQGDGKKSGVGVKNIYNFEALPKNWKNMKLVWDSFSSAPINMTIVGFNNSENTPVTGLIDFSRMIRNQSNKSEIPELAYDITLPSSSSEHPLGGASGYFQLLDNLQRELLGLLQTFTIRKIYPDLTAQISDCRQMAMQILTVAPNHKEEIPEQEVIIPASRSIAFDRCVRNRVIPQLESLADGKDTYSFVKGSIASFYALTGAHKWTNSSELIY